MINSDCALKRSLSGPDKRHSRNRVAVALNILFLHLQLAKWPTDAELEETENERDVLLTVVFFYAKKLQFNVFYNFEFIMKTTLW